MPESNVSQTGGSLSERILAVRQRIGLINADIDKPSAMRDEPDLIWACRELREIAEFIDEIAAERDRYYEALTKINDMGAVCADFMECTHPSCRDLCAAKLTALAALNGEDDMTDHLGQGVCPTCGSSERHQEPNYCSDAWHKADVSHSVSPRGGRDHVGCPKCGLIAQVLSDLTDPEDVPWCCHAEYVHWRQPDPRSELDWTRMVRVDVLIRGGTNA